MAENQEAKYFPGIGRLDIEEFIEKVGSGNPNKIPEFNRRVNEMPYPNNENEPLWMLLYTDLELYAGDYPDEESVEHALNAFTSCFQTLCHIVAFIFDPVKKENVKLFFQEKLNEL